MAEHLGPVEILQQGARHTVALERRAGLVRKTFHGGAAADDRAAAEREYDRLLRFSEALRGHPMIACPRPVELSLSSSPPYVRMQRAPGVPMVDYLQHHTLAEPTRRVLAETLAHAVAVYVDTFEEPYWDLHFRNMLVDPVRHQVVLLDFDIPEPVGRRRDLLGSTPSLDVSLGNLVGSTIFNASRPNQLRRGRLHRQSIVLAAETVDACLRDQGTRSRRPPQERTVAETARVCYWLSAGSGTRLRRWWYRTAGHVLARRTCSTLRPELRPFASSSPRRSGD